MPRRTAIGLDIGTSVVRAAELSYGRAGVTLDRFGQLVLPPDAVHDGQVVDPEAVAKAVRKLWTATKLSHKRVVLGVANQRVIVRQLELPWLARSELAASLPFQVQDLLPMPVDQAVLDFFPVEELTDSTGARTLKGLLVAASRETVLANVRAAELAGLSVQAVDLTPFAVLRALGRQTGAAVETEALIDIGARVTNIVVHSGGVPRFVRILLVGGQDVTDAISEQLRVPAAEAEVLKQQVSGSSFDEGLEEVVRTVSGTAQDFVTEIRGSLDYYQASNPTAPVERLVVTGGGSRLAGILDRLAAATRLPVRSGDPMAHLRIGKTGLDDAQLS
ncbi:MAG TPA: type IV pilus assembly protein PilM, partial [Kineosporiaceae bacterium]|nr:type IV pilus assembly protein PilM [Kineosporiaceae bacterium]